MSDLRSACIEAMARSLQEANLEGGFTWQEYLPDARAGLDALLGVLEEHADEWVHAASGAALDDAVQRGDHKLADVLLAVLREDT